MGPREGVTARIYVGNKGAARIKDVKSMITRRCSFRLLRTSVAGDVGICADLTFKYSIGFRDAQRASQVRKGDTPSQR
jgi:hypothetical protein